MITRFFLICSFLCVATLSKAQQSNSIQKADSFYSVKKYFEAAIWYERNLFENDFSTPNTLAVFGKLNCLKNLESYDEAAIFLKSININNWANKEKQAIKYQQILCAYLSSKYENVISSVFLYKEEMDDSKIGRAHV